MQFESWDVKQDNGFVFPQECDRQWYPGLGTETAADNGHDRQQEEEVGEEKGGSGNAQLETVVCVISSTGEFCGGCFGQYFVLFSASKPKVTLKIDRRHVCLCACSVINGKG